MRYYLPMTRPDYEDDNESRGYYATTLDVTKMPEGMAAGEYAFAVVHNMTTPRSIEDYSNGKCNPWLSWDDLIAHLEQYGARNGWSVDDAERAVHTMLRKGATVGGNWKSTLVEWPFSGDACLLAWADAVVKTNMLTVRDKERTWGNNQNNTDTSTQLGRWLAQRPYLLPQAAPVLQALAQYVQTVDGMGEAQFELMASKYHSEQVLLFGGPRPGRLDKRPVAQNPLSRVFPHPDNTDWSDTAFRSFALGMAWEMRAQGKARAFVRLTQLLNRNKVWTSGAQLALFMKDAPWVNTAMGDMVAYSARIKSLDEKSHQLLNGNDGMDAFYPVHVGALAHQEQHGALVKIIQQEGNAPWAQAFCRISLFMALQGTFHNSGHWGHQAHTRLLASEKLFPMLDQHQRDALFTELVLALPTVAGRSANAYHKDHPWMSFADSMFNAWAMPRHEGEVEETSAMEVFVSWLAAWEHPYKKDVAMMASIALDCGQLGSWLHDAVVRKAPVEDPVQNEQAASWDVGGLF